MQNTAADLERDTRTIILDAAEDLVAAQGVQNLTFDALARSSGVSKGGILYHFRSKEDLATAMIERAIDQFDTAVTRAAARDSSVHGRFTRAYLAVSLGLVGDDARGRDRLTASLTTALLNHQQGLEPIRHQGARHQSLIEADGLDPVTATMARLVVDGLWLAENFGLMRYDDAMKRAVVERLRALTQETPMSGKKQK